jgi:hypothetical protein
VRTDLLQLLRRRPVRYGTYTVQGSAARAQYAATAVPALPLLSAMTRDGRSWSASSASMTAPRSLNDRVGIR